MSASPAYDFDPKPFYADIFDTDLGRKLWDFINEGSTIDLMKDASDRGRPAVEPLQEDLLKRHEQEGVREKGGGVMRSWIATTTWGCASRIPTRPRVVP